MGHVKLKKAWSIAIGLGDFLDRGTSCRGEAVREIELAGDFGDGGFAGWVVDLVYADWGEADGCGHAVAEDFGACVAVVGVD